MEHFEKSSNMEEKNEKKTLIPYISWVPENQIRYLPVPPLFHIQLRILVVVRVKMYSN